MDHEELGKVYNLYLSSEDNMPRHLQRLFDSLEYGKKGFHSLMSGDKNVDQYKTQLMIFIHESGCSYSYMDLSFSYIDSIVNEKLNQVGIDFPYELGIYNTVNQSFEFESSGRFTKELMEEGVKFNLLSMNKCDGAHVDYLIIYFPRLNYYFFTKSIVLLTISLLVLMLVLFCFIYTIRTIKRQKTLTETKSDFVNNMTHELKTPIATIGLACQALTDKDIPKDEQMISSYIKIITDENNRLKKLVEEVLNAARFDKGMFSAKFANIDMHKLLEEAIQLHKLTTESKKGVIYTDFKAKNYHVYGDRMHILNAMSNLLDNALKYCDKVPEIYVRTRNLHGELEIRIQDNGPGISKINQKKVFDEFFRISTGNLHDVKGHGMGLNYVKKVMEFNRGSIKIESELHRGAIFVVTLPLIKKSK
jgi:Signal transduction histidine kinase